MSFLLWVLLIFLFILVIYFAVGIIAALTLTRVGPHPQFDNDPSTFGVGFERVEFPSRKDHIKIAAWYIPKPDTKKAIILVHGRNASKQNAISGTLPKLAAELHKTGLAVLTIDLRAHGESEGKRYMWGVKERWDVLGAVDFLLDKGFTTGSIAVLGISLGGAAAIGAASESDAIGAVALDSTFADLQTLIDPNWKTESGLPKLFLPGVYWMWQVRFGQSLRSIKPVKEIVRIPPRQILILHCENDKQVDIQHARQLVKAVPEAKLVLFSHCEHAELYRDQPEKYLDALLPFLQVKWGS
jgi:dipeptidyl aminopeptidase/acylaminoacyl peptidase